MVKTWMKTASGLKVQQLDIQQQALKLTANRLMLTFVFYNLRMFSLHAVISVSLPLYFYFFSLCMAGMLNIAVCMDALDFPIQDFMQSLLQRL